MKGLFVLFALLAGLLLVGCGSGEGPVTEGDSKAGAAGVTPEQAGIPKREGGMDRGNYGAPGTGRPAVQDDIVPGK